MKVSVTRRAITYSGSSAIQLDGTWWMAVMKEGQWNPFRMDLGDHKQRESFFQGQIPKGAKLP